MTETKQSWREVLRFAIWILPIAAIGGYCSGRYVLLTYTPELRQAILEQIGSAEMFAATTAAQSVIYALIAGVLGYIIAKKIGLLRPFGFHWKELRTTLLITLISGIVLAADYWTFSAAIPNGRDNYEILYKNADNWIASILYGGVVEEVMMRLFVMSLAAWVLWKLAARDKEQVPTGLLIAANVISATLFAAGHLPTAASMYGELSPLIVTRIMLLNGVFGLVFGWLYRTKGIQYAMTAHAGTHIVSKLIWLLWA
ncbi:MAG: CPBP family intramembrane metalloprotease [Bacteroidales bacterium]|nr:CPBP family intramembrane metalloprotease [Bacteroidales bacterium]